MNPVRISYLEAKKLVGEKANEIDIFCDFWTDFYKDSGFFYLYEQTTNLSFLNLEFGFYDFDSDLVGLIFCKDLIAENIFTESNDEGTNLIVLGSVFAKKIALGGQEIFIDGSLIIENFFMGSYNHGSLSIKNNFNCPIIIKDDYEIKVGNKLVGNVYSWEIKNWEMGIFLKKKGRFTEFLPIEQLKIHFDSSYFDKDDNIDFYKVSKSLHPK